MNNGMLETATKNFCLVRDMFYRDNLVGTRAWRIFYDTPFIFFLENSPEEAYKILCEIYNHS